MPSRLTSTRILPFWTIGFFLADYLTCPLFCFLGLEGLIGKRCGSRYEAGKRSGAWIKLKFHQEQEFVIGGYTEPEGSRNYFGALLVGY